MGTLVCFHAHPDDEAIATGGTMALAAEAGHRVVLIVATRGEQGEPVDGVLTERETLGERRSIEVVEAAQILGADQVEFLDYVDSGMMGEPTNDAPDSFWGADPDDAADSVAKILRGVGCTALTIYDENGGYGHPDHIQVHRVGLMAAGRIGLDAVYQATMNRTQIRQQMAEAAPELEAAGVEVPDAGEQEDFGTPESDITHAVDVSTVVRLKREAMVAHRSQIAEDSFFLAMSDDFFGVAFGTEWYIDPRTARSSEQVMRTTII